MTTAKLFSTPPSPTTITFIVGPTATSKTSIAIALAKKIGATILSADSRQVFRELAITSGTDLQTEFLLSPKKVGGYQFFSNGNTNIFGVNFLPRYASWSIAQFRELAESVYTYCTDQHKPLIIVGGSGLYHRSLFLDKQQLNIKPSEQLRSELEAATISDLQKKLLKLLPKADSFLNESDWNNPRRLIRWIEKLSASPSHTSNSSHSTSVFGKETDHQWYGIQFDLEQLKKIISNRVATRIKNGAIQEVEAFLTSPEAKQWQSYSTMGVKEIEAYLNEQISQQELITVWTQREFKYAKRQITWFKKMNSIQWVTRDAILR